jgi:hypothetical protein
MKKALMVVVLGVCLYGCDPLVTSERIEAGARTGQQGARIAQQIPGAAPFATLADVILGAVAMAAGGVAAYYRGKQKGKEEK